ncbi:hypothetical protein M409DRAFT_48361 [Zasmidium cellare ATCC 36951]|uniref:Cystathionine gamma-synthase n=1 Tax=Zasmidium cellare ATCC 36951 TaxID=1080233 RepID=A0A6A6D2G1_ZASCE|nr:uncharacterized protein M409DRAFT_48361 [Zasmidium cellare ATCC 36951]KAF2173375.1 hypothetical protein M409DRAFT_48361 [Zasmidium cellare ATCC 36951]
MAGTDTNRDSKEASNLITTPSGDAIPPFTPHSVTFHIHSWATLIYLVENPEKGMAALRSTYPRFGPWALVKELTGAVASDYIEKDQGCLLFGSKDSALACRDFVMSEKRGDKKMQSEEVHVKAFDFRIRLWAVVFPAKKTEAAIPFWQDAGTGISSRIAKECLDRCHLLKPVDDLTDGKDRLSTDSSAFEIVKSRIAENLNRSPISARPRSVASTDVFLYPTGMAAIYQLQRYLNNSGVRPGTTILFGFVFHSTPHVYKQWSSAFKWFGRGNEDLDNLEAFCASEQKAGRPIQALWTEYPSNPNLRVHDLTRLKALADEHGILLIIDETISSFCNVDLVDVADVLITSLTKSFSGYADVMGGSIVLNPNSKHHDSLSEICRKGFINEYFTGDVEALEQNSRDYLERSRRLNANAYAIATYLDSFVKDPNSPISKIAYPSIGPDAQHYKAFMRPSTPDFTPGYGCLLSIELESIDTAIAFYDNLHVHQGPHLGAHRTPAMPYVRALHYKEMDWVKECGMSDRMVRVSAGLEGTENLLGVFEVAVEKAREAKAAGEKGDQAVEEAGHVRPNLVSG